MTVNIYTFLVFLIVNTGTVVVEVEGLRNTEGRLFL